MDSFWMVFLLAMAVAFAIAFLRKGKVGMPMTSRQREVTLSAAPAEVFAALRGIPRPYVVDDSDPKSNVIILSRGMGLLGGWGFLFPVFIAPAPGGGSHLTIGCTSKVIQMGPLVTRSHDKCVEAIEAQLAIPAARVVA
jgi:hypothetical protein